MEVADFCRMLEDVLELPTDTVKSHQKLKELSGWDSMATLGVMAAVDDRWNKSIAPKDIMQCVTVADLHAAAQK